MDGRVERPAMTKKKMDCRPGHDEKRKSRAPPTSLTPPPQLTLSIARRFAHGQKLSCAKSARSTACDYRCNISSYCDCEWLQTKQRLSQPLEGSRSVPHISRVLFENGSAWNISVEGRVANARIRECPTEHSEGSVSQLGRTRCPQEKQNVTGPVPLDCGARRRPSFCLHPYRVRAFQDVERPFLFCLPNPTEPMSQTRQRQCRVASFLQESRTIPVGARFARERARQNRRSASLR
jgi:hypothetical protein